MPRTTVVESSGCPPLRALTTDILGLVKGSQRPSPFPSAACPLVVFSLLRSTDSTHFPAGCSRRGPREAGGRRQGRRDVGRA
jgi:hypothetical protein